MLSYKYVLVKFIVLIDMFKNFEYEINHKANLLCKKPVEGKEDIMYIFSNA